MKMSVRHIVIGLGVAAMCGAGVFWLGLINVGASTGHWALTDWLLHTAMRRSVQFRADTLPPEDFASEAMIRRGAAHFETGCAPCHGSPGAPRGAVVRAMTPEPPDLLDQVDQWTAADLFWIVKHGVKFTGMPAWPAPGRDDEVWSMVAFLKFMPSLDAQGYHGLAYGAEQIPNGRQRVLSVTANPALADCVRCHGLDGRGDGNGAFPRLDIQDEAYLHDALQAYAGGHRFSGIMQEATAGLDGETLAILAAYFAQQSAGKPFATAQEPLEAERLQRGKIIAMRGLPDNNVASCAGCHDRTGTQSRSQFPRLSGQYRTYIETQLRLFSTNTKRGGGPFANIMRQSSHALEDADIEAVAAWYAMQTPNP